MEKNCFLILLFYLVSTIGYSQRHVTNLNALWEFKRAVDEKYQWVNLPHTYNTEDAFDDEPGYYRGKSHYRKALASQNFDPDQDHLLRIHAANQYAEVFVNGKKAGSHKGGYTAFTIDIGPYLNYQNDTLTIMVDNSHDESVPPLRGDFTFYGGIYREVEILHLSEVHFKPDFYGADAAFIDPVNISDQKAELRIWGLVDNFDPQNYQVQVSIADGEGRQLVEKTINSTLYDIPGWETTIVLDNPKLWSIEEPYLYEVRCLILEKTSGEVFDELKIPYGIRYFSFDPDNGFSLNGQYRKLIGVNRHQDRPGIGNALTTAHHIDDVALIEEIGANFLRTAHYPQDRDLLNRCDRAGIVVSMEIPLDHEITPGQAFADNCKLMTLEMLYQYYNHPSIVVWAYMNEMGLGMQIERDSAIMWQVSDLAQELEKLIRETDPYRYTMIPNHGYFDVYHHFKLTEIPMIVGWNLYYGWYEQELKGLGPFMDHAHEQLPDKPMLITEYGAGADPRITSFDPLRFDFSLDWSLIFHQANLRQILDRKYIAGSAVWNMFDFGSESRNDAVPHVNNKGLCSFDRKPKPVFYLYQAHLRKEKVAEIEALPPFVILSSSGKKTVPVALISNQQELTLRHNNEPLSMDFKDLAATKDITLREGKNTLSVDGFEGTTSIQGYTWEGFWRENAIFRLNLGTNFFFTPADGIGQWYPAEEMPEGILAIEGGQRLQKRNRGIGSDRPVALTDDDPVYQTMMLGLEQLELPLPGGTYELVVHLANLSNEQGAQQIKVGAHQLEIPSLPTGKAFSTSCRIQVDGRLRIEFNSKDQSTYISGLEIIKL